MAFPDNLTNAIDGVTEIEAAHLNNLEAKVGVNNSTDPNSLDYQLRNENSIDPGHKHTHAALSGTMGVDGDVLHKASGTWSPKTPDAAGLVDKSTNQMVGGVKTFSEIPVLPGTDPTSANQAVRKGYVDAQRDTRVAKAGDTMTGPLVLPGDPTAALQAATKQYVDNGIATHAALPNAHHNQAHDIQGADHTASGLTVGQVLRATSATTFAFQALQESDLPTHKHSKLWESDGGAEAIDVDAAGILKIPSKVAPSSSQTDAALVWTEDVNGQAGKAGLHMMNEGLSGVKLVVAGIYIKATTGDPTTVYEGLIVLNTYDNTLKIYADEGWRTLATWS
jgi:hypothetical protein